MPNPVQGHNLNVTFVPHQKKNDSVYDDQTFDDQVIEYFIILVRKQDIVAYSGRENPKICTITQSRNKRKPLTKDVGEHRRCYRAVQLPLPGDACRPR